MSLFLCKLMLRDLLLQTYINKVILTMLLLGRRPGQQGPRTQLSDRGWGDKSTCGGRGSEWLTPSRRGINSSLKEKKKKINDAIERSHLYALFTTNENYSLCINLGHTRLLVVLSIFTSLCGPGIFSRAMMQNCQGFSCIPYFCPKEWNGLQMFL